MIKTFYEIGKILQKQEEYSSYFGLSENPFPNTKEAKDVIVVNVNKENDFSFSTEPFKTSLLNKYLFRSLNSSRSPSLVPTLYLFIESNEIKLTESIEKFISKLNRCFDNNKEIYSRYFDPEQLMDFIKSNIKQYISEFMKGNYLFTLIIDGKYVGDHPEFAKILEDEALQMYYQDKKSVSKAQNKVCAVSYQQVEEVWGRISTLGFTVNDLSFNRNGFNPKDSYKMFPVTPDAVKILEGSKRFIESKLSYNFYGLQYIILPHFVALEESLVKEILTEFIKHDNSNKFETQGEAIIYNERIINEICNDEKLHSNNVYYDIFFYEAKQAQFSIKLHLSDVLPSRLAKIFYIKEKNEKLYRKIIQSFTTKESKIIEYSPNFSEIKRFFSIEKLRPYKVIFHPYFFKILEAVFYGTSLNEQTILSSFLDTIRISFKDTKNTFRLASEVKRSFAIHQFFANLNLFNIKYMENNSDKLNLTVEGFIVQNNNFFGADAYKKSVFRLGCLTGILLQKQYNKLKSEPFRKELNGLNLDEKNIQVILPKLIDKLRQYETSIPELETSIAMGLVAKCNLTKVEISYVFTLGMIMQKEFTNAYFREK